VQNVLGFQQRGYTTVVKHSKMTLGGKRTAQVIVILVVLPLLVGVGHQLLALMDTMVQNNAQMIVVMFFIDIVIVTLHVLLVLVLQEHQRVEHMVYMLHILVLMSVVKVAVEHVDV